MLERFVGNKESQYLQFFIDGKRVKGYMDDRLKREKKSIDKTINKVIANDKKVDKKMDKKKAMKKKGKGC